jgi:hypothetical protein
MGYLLVREMYLLQQNLQTCAQSSNLAPVSLWYVSPNETWITKTAEPGTNSH